MYTLLWLTTSRLWEEMATRLRHKLPPELRTHNVGRKTDFHKVVFWLQHAYCGITGHKQSTQQVHILIGKYFKSYTRKSTLRQKIIEECSLCLPVSLPCSPFLYIGQWWTLSVLQQSNLARLVGDQVPGIFLALLPQCQDYWFDVPCWVVMGIPGIQCQVLIPSQQWLHQLSNLSLCEFNIGEN